MPIKKAELVRLLYVVCFLIIYQTHATCKDDSRRQKDIPYNVQSVTIKDPSSTRNIMLTLRGLAGTTIIDTPGSLTQEGMKELLANADYIVCPYHYDLNTIDSTRAFILAVLRLKHNLSLYAISMMYE